MSFAREFALQPELVTDVIEELLDADIIAQNKIKQLKCENTSLRYDPNILMDIRHYQVRKQMSTSENKCLADKKNNILTRSQNRMNYLEVDKEIERFKKELENERKKLYELTRLSYEYKKTVSKDPYVISQPIPVTNVFTQLKNKLSQSSSELNGTETQMIKRHVEFENTPFEVFGYKPYSLTVPTGKKACLNEHSSFCPHKKPVEKPVSVKEEEETAAAFKERLLLRNNKSKDNSIKPESGFYFGGSITNCNQINKVLATKTIDKWKSYVIDKKTNRCSKEERLFRLKQRKYLLRKYWNKWLDFKRDSRRKKEESIKQKIKTEKMNLFFEKLEERKRDLDKNQTPVTNFTKKSNKIKETLNRPNHTSTGQRGSVFTNRLKAQKAIIQEQKEKLKEKDKVIQKLQEEKAQESVKLFSDNVKSTLSDTVRNFDVRLKPQIRQLANKANIYMNNCGKVTECDFVKRMSDRAKERKERWEMIRLKKQLLEDEKKRQEVEDEEKKREEEKQIKRNKIREEKEKIKLQKEIELKNLLEIEETKMKMKNADEYYKKKLLRTSIKALYRNVLRGRELEIKCKIQINKLLLRACFKKWKSETEYSVQRDVATANAFYTFNLISCCWSNWILYYSEAVQKRQVAEDFYDAKLQERAFTMWKDYINKQYIMRERHLEYAICYYNRKLKRKYFNYWKKLPKAMYNVREEEKRIRAWREKILEIIPDFKPELIYNEEDIED